jgi:hypothetical protein
MIGFRQVVRILCHPLHLPTLRHTQTNRRLRLPPLISYHRARIAHASLIARRQRQKRKNIPKQIKKVTGSQDDKSSED